MRETILGKQIRYVPANLLDHLIPSAAKSLASAAARRWVGRR